MKKNSGEPFRGSLICSAHGNCSTAQGHARCCHFLRTVLPSLSAAYAEGHDRAMQEVMSTLLEGLPVDEVQQ